MVQILFWPISLISPLRVFLLLVTEKGSSFTLDQSSHSLLFVGFFFSEVFSFSLTLPPSSLLLDLAKLLVFLQVQYQYFVALFPKIFVTKLT